MAAPGSVKPMTGVKGMDIVLRNLNRELAKMQTLSMAGLIEAVMLVEQDMYKTPPMVPWDTGNLAGSWFRTPHYTPQGPFVLMGFTANYALWVHENMDSGIKWNKPGSGPKFLEAALKRNKDEILRIIGETLKLNK